MSALAALVAVASSVLGQAQDAPSSRLMKEYADTFLGPWTSEFITDTDLPGVWEKGDKVVATSTSTWGIPGIVILMDFTAEIEGKTVLRTKGIAGVDPKDQRIKLKWFDSAGDCGEIAYTREGGTWTSTWSSVDAAGVEGKNVGTLKVVDADTHVWKTTQRTRNGETLPDESNTWKRKRP